MRTPRGSADADRPRTRHSPPAADDTGDDDTPAAAPRPDARMRRADALAYWAGVPATLDGMLGGYAGVTRADLQGSRNFLAKLRRRRLEQQQQHAPAAHNGSRTPATTTGPWLARAADCGAGIGRVTLGLLAHVAATVDAVEPVAKFAAELESGTACAGLRAEGRLARVHAVGLEDWRPRPGVYDLVWNQWCLGHLTDGQLVGYLRRAGEGLCGGGWVVVKENLSTEPGGADLFDEQDSSVTRSEESWRRAFGEAGLRVVAEEVQRGLPGELYPVKMFALQPVVGVRSGE